MARSTSVLEKTADPHARCARARFLEAKGAEGRGAREPSVERLDGERSRRYSAPTRLDTSTRDSVELSLRHHVAISRSANHAGPSRGTQQELPVHPGALRPEFLHR